jgi:hypothetical protein
MTSRGQAHEASRVKAALARLFAGWLCTREAASGIELFHV